MGIDCKKQMIATRGVKLLEWTKIDSEWLCTAVDRRRQLRLKTDFAVQEMQKQPCSRDVWMGCLCRRAGLVTCARQSKLFIYNLPHITTRFPSNMLFFLKSLACIICPMKSSIPGIVGIIADLNVPTATITLSNTCFVMVEDPFCWTWTSHLTNISRYTYDEEHKQIISCLQISDLIPDRWGLEIWPNSVQVKYKWCHLINKNFWYFTSLDAVLCQNIDRLENKEWFDSETSEMGIHSFCVAF